MSAHAIGSWPPCIAICKAVRPALFSVAAAAPLLNRAVTRVAGALFSAAKWRAVDPVSAWAQLIASDSHKSVHASRPAAGQASAPA